MQLLNKEWFGLEVGIEGRGGERIGTCLEAVNEAQQKSLHLADPSACARERKLGDLL